MAPGTCMADFPMPRTDAAYPHSRRRQRNRGIEGIVEKHRTLERRQMSIARVRVGSPHDAAASSRVADLEASVIANYGDSILEFLYPERIHAAVGEERIVLQNRAGLLNIIARTIDLVQRNRILEKKVKALRLETRRFVDSVIKKPENNERIQGTCEENDASNTSENVAPEISDVSSWQSAIREQLTGSFKKLFENEASLVSIKSMAFHDIPERMLH